MIKIAIPVLATFGSAVWLWAWNRFVPRPPDRAVVEQFEDRPPGSLAFFGTILFLLAPVFVILLLRPPIKPGEELAKEESLRLGLLASLMSAPIVIGGIIAVASIYRNPRVPGWTYGVRLGDVKSAAIEGVRACWEWLPLVVCVNALVRAVLSKAPDQINPIEEILRGHYGVEMQILAATAAVLRAPFVEELVFRGLLQTWFNEFTAWPGMLCASILFAAVHSSAWPDPVPLVLVGLMLGIAYQRTRNLVAPIVAHALFNGAMTALALTNFG